MLIRLQRIYNFLLFHVVILSFLDVLQSCYSHFISFFGTNLLTYCPVPAAIFCMFFTSQEINIKQSPNAVKFFVDFFGPEDIQWAKEVPKREREVSTRHQGAPGGPGAPWWVVPPLGQPPGASLVHLVSSGPNKIHKKFRCIWTPFDIDFLRCKKQAKNSNWHWALCQ